MNRLTPKRRYYTNTKNFVISVYEATVSFLAL